MIGVVEVYERKGVVIVGGGLTELAVMVHPGEELLGWLVISTRSWR